MEAEKAELERMAEALEKEFAHEDGEEGESDEGDEPAPAGEDDDEY